MEMFLDKPKCYLCGDTFGPDGCKLSAELVERKEEIKRVYVRMAGYDDLVERLHTANGDLSPVEYEQNSLRKVS